MAEHDTLGQTRGAGGVDHGGPVVGLYLALATLYFAHPLVAVGDAELEDFERAVLAVDLG